MKKLNDKPHDSAHNHVSGKSEYIDDRPMQKNELHVEVIFSKKAHAKIISLNFERALACRGVIAAYTGEDFAHNLWGTIFKDQPILATGKVQFAGEPIALLVGSDRVELQYAKQLVEVILEELPAIKSIDQARSQNSFIADARFIKRGSPDETLANCPNKISGRIVIQGADHFYLESQASIAYPLEDGQLEIHSSSQHPTETQHVVAHALGLPDKDVVCVVKRMGGGFGGKESQAAPFAAMAALVAHKLKRPARLVLTKDDDMIMTGKRNPFQNDYQVGFDNEGRILALKVELFSDSGAYADLSTSIMERAMLHSDNAYYIPHMEVVGRVCKTNFHPSTAFRGFGGPKGVATIERIIEEIAHKLNKDPLEVRKLNVYQDERGRNVTHYGQVFRNNCLPKLFSELEKKSHYHNRRKKIDEFNKKSDQFLKGLSLTAVKFGISFTTRFLNQANALVIIHLDGSLQISTGATEMGQGVNARISQMVTEELGLERDQARVMPTRTDKNANTSPTAASSGTDLNGAAAVLATRKIKARLSELALYLITLPEEKWAARTAGLGTQAEYCLKSANLEVNDPNQGADWKSGVASYHGILFKDGFVFAEKNPAKKISFADLVREAYLNRISLSDYAFYRIPGIEFNKLTGQGDAFLYFTQGVALSEVTLNRDTGEVKVDATEILMDLGRPVNRELDVGQVSGAFIQGMGWVTTENLFYNRDGLLLSHAPSTYKIPSIQDTPRKYSIELLANDENYANVRGTKAVGEPPLLLAISVWTAIQNALTYLPIHAKNYPRLKIPATSEEILRQIHPIFFKDQTP
jgi:xanthine dehydrogenase large subunit